MTDNIKYDSLGRRRADMSKAVSRGGKKINWRSADDMDKCTKCKSPLDTKHKYWCRACSKEWRDRHYSENPEKRKGVTASAIKWISKNPERAAEYKKKHANSERAKETKREWIRKNPERAKLWDANKNYKRRAAIGDDTISFDEWQWVLRQYNNNCAYCGCFMEKPTRDHYIPLSRGGRNIISNIVPSCHSCNSSKHAKTGEKLKEWIMDRKACESMIMREIMVEASERGHRLFRNNVGVARYGRSTVPYGLGVGSPDLIGWTSDGTFVAIEVKAPGKRPKKHQNEWREAALLSCPTLRIGWADSVERAMEILEGPRAVPASSDVTPR